MPSHCRWKTGSPCSAIPTLSRWAPWPTKCASGCTATAPTSTATCTSTPPTCARRAVSSARSRACRKAAGAYTMSLEEAWGKLRARLDAGMLTEIHIVNGLHPGLPFSTTTELLRGAQAHPAQHPPQGLHRRRDLLLRQQLRHDHREVLERSCAPPASTRCQAAAPRFSRERVRRKICDDKCDADEWLDIHRVAHRMGLRSNCTMLYGTIETSRSASTTWCGCARCKTRRAASRPSSRSPSTPTTTRSMKLPGPTGVEDLRTYAVARLMLDNIPHIKAYWIMLGVKAAQIALVVRRRRPGRHGPGREDLPHGRRRRRPRRMTPGGDRPHHPRAGRMPVERDTLYNVVAEGPALDAVPSVVRRSLEVLA